MRLSLSCSHRQSLDLTGGLTLSIFPLVERWLNATTDHQNALEWAAARKSMDRYHSVVDFLFCETYQNFRARCFAFYDDEGPQLKDTITAEQRTRFEKGLMSVLAVAYEAFCADRRVSWGWVRDEGLARAA